MEWNIFSCIYSRLQKISSVPSDNEIIDVNREYISKFNFTRKNQIVLLKISDGSEKGRFLALKSEQKENRDCMKTTKSFSRLMRDI